ncbi:NAD+ synthetase [Agrobacterium tumefaciens]|uniref:nitrilase-related carbon-nitrogen hydrolase n=1 Tax=Agrobacterium tumefaciens TaxID=358 RepID=UPI0015745131|nr:nitrilase-related carbon-nitrogen hydrolase [Agrobacterium tumefaciens]NTB97248.1 NAD+ synthetase [Agrobacterium tumefaciens]NTC43421.1 NAD+ synthetase [Agrobacterium tumefaciens]
MSILTVAAAQIQCVAGDIEANKDLHIEAIHAAKAQGVELLAFPELSLTDYLSAPDVSVLARPIQAREIQEVVAAADGLAISFGFIEVTNDGSIYNTQALFSNGELIHAHRKINIPTYGLLQEGKYYRKGEDLDIARLPQNWNAATLICADSWSPALPWIVALQGADLLMQPIGSARGVVDGEFDNPTGWDINLRHTAMTYSLPTIMINHCGRRGSLDFWGGSRILDQNGFELARAGEEPTLLTACLDLAKVQFARQNLPTLRDSDPEFVLAHLAKAVAGR